MSKTAWLVVEGSRHGLRISDAELDVVTAESAQQAATLYEESHDGPLERLYVFPFEPLSFDVETVIRPVSA